MIEPGDWFITRPSSLREDQPPPKCREMLWDHLEPRIAKEKEDEASIWKKKKCTLIATLPNNHTFGPVHRVSFQCVGDIWELMVYVPSICGEAVSSDKLMVWVTVSHGTTQWARWQAHTGDSKRRCLQDPPPPDCTHARNDISLNRSTLPEGLLGDGKDGLESWQDHVPFSRVIPREERKWATLPCTALADQRDWLLQSAMEVLRHENLHDPVDGAVCFPRSFNI